MIGKRVEITFGMMKGKTGVIIDEEKRNKAVYVLIDGTKIEFEIGAMQVKEIKEVNTLDRFLNSWKEAARVYYTDLKEEMDQVQNTDYELTADNLRIIKKDAYSKRFQTQKYSEEKIQKLLNSELSSHVVRNLKIEISRYKFIEWAEGKTQSEVNFIRLIDTPEDLETALNGMVAEKKNMFLSRVENKAGKILDMSGLGFGIDGSINGKVIGQEKTVNVKTTFAGGHTVQCLHYRVLVK